MPKLTGRINTKPCIKIYEYELLRVGERKNGYTFTESDWHELLIFNERRYPPIFQIVHRGIKALHYVGFIETSRLTLEILPKTSIREQQDHRQLLCQMLEICGEIPKSKSPAKLSTHAYHVNEFIFGQFLNEVEILSQKGLANAYHYEESNNNKFRGKLIVSEHIRRNYANKQRSYTSFQKQDGQHLLNAIIATALQFTLSRLDQVELHKKARQLIGFFSTQRILNPKDICWRDIHLGREQIRYAAALQWSRLILKTYGPLHKQGQFISPNFLYDAQRLFEQVVAKLLSIAAEKRGYKITLQASQAFWRKRKLKPDMVLRVSEGETIILDTKWKLLNHGQPDESDLKQMYIYNRFFNAQRGVLIYPRSEHVPTHELNYREPYHDGLHCEILYVNLQGKSGNFNYNLGEEIMINLLENPPLP